MNPVQAFVDTYNVAGYETTASQFVSFSFAITQEFDAEVPIRVLTPSTTITAGAEVWLFRSCDGGNSWETEGTFMAAFPATAAATMRKAMHLETGQYILSTCVGGYGGDDGLRVTVALDTAWLITAYA